MKKLLKIVAGIIVAIILAALAYAAYVFIDYHRIDDNLQLDITQVASDIPQPGVTYSLTTFNIGFGAYSQDYSFFMDGGEYSRAYSEAEAINNINGSANIISAIDPDFAFFQEVDIDATRSYHLDEYLLLEENLPDYSSVFAMNYDSPYLFYPIMEPHGKSASGIVTFSKYAVDTSLRRSLPIETGLRKLLDLDRCYSITKISVTNGKQLCLINLHLSAFTEDVTIGETQLKMLFADAQREYEAGNYVICGGDFNKDIPGNSPELFGTTREVPNWAKPMNKELFPENFTYVQSTDAPNINPTLRASDTSYVEGESFITVVDGFIVSDNIEVVYAENIDAGFIYSDHNPVLMKFILK